MSAHVYSYRGDLIENRHTASLAVVNPAGRLIAYAGNPELPAHLRSSSKPFQAQALFQTHAVQHFALTPKEIAVSCASHCGSPDMPLPWRRPSVRNVRRLEVGWWDAQLELEWR